MFKKRLAGAITALSVALTASSAIAQNVSLNFSPWLPPAHFMHQDVLFPWFKEIERVTEGRVKVEILPKTVGTAATQYDVIRDGLADVAFIIPGYTPGRFVLSEIMELPLLGGKGRANSIASDKIYREHLAKYNEFGSVKVVSLFTIAPLNPYNKTRPINRIEDFRGLKLRAPVPLLSKLLPSIGAVPILKTSTEAFELLSTGAIDGQFSTADIITSFNAQGLMKYGTLIPGGLANPAELIAVNKQKWDQISEADRKAIDGISSTLAAAAGAKSEEIERATFDVLRKAGWQIHEADEALISSLQEATKAIIDDWIKRAKEKGVEDPASILSKLREEIALQEKRG